MIDPLSGAAVAASPPAPAVAVAPDLSLVSLALAALAARIRVVEARIEREPRWIPGPTLGEVCAVQQRLYPRTRGRSQRSLDRVEARILAALLLPPGALAQPSAGVSLASSARGLLS